MAAAYDNSVTVDGFGVTTLTTGSFTIAGSNRAACLALAYYAAVTSITGSCGGQTATAIASAAADNGGGNGAVKLFGVTAPATGSQTATLSWTTSSSASLGAVTATGVDQATPLTNGANATTGFGTTVGGAVTSTSGDLTVTCSNDANNDTGKTSNQTKKLSDFGCVDVGPGTGTVTHTWTTGSATAMSWAGANFLAVGGGGVTVAQEAGIWAAQQSSGVIGRVDA